MSDRIYRYCLTCGNVTVADAGYYAGSSFYHCETCGRRGMSDMFPRATVFHQIAASPEVLAPHFVREVCTAEGANIVERWVSAIVPDIYYETEAEAIAATVAKLKEFAE